MEYVVQEETKKVVEEQLRKARLMRQKQVRQQANQWSEERRRKFDEEKERQIVLMTRKIVEEVEQNAKSRIEHLLLTHDLAVAEVGAAHRAAAQIREAEKAKEVKRLQSQQLVKERGQAALGKVKSVQGVKSQVALDRNKRKEVLRTLDQNRMEALKKAAVDKKPESKTELAKPKPEPKPSNSRNLVAVKNLDKSVKNNLAKRISKERNSPDAWEKAEVLSKRSMEQLEAKVKRQEEIQKRAEERGKQALKKASLEKRLSALTNELMKDTKDFNTIGSGNQVSLLDLSEDEKKKAPKDRTSPVPVAKKKEESLVKRPIKESKAIEKRQEGLPRKADEGGQQVKKASSENVPTSTSMNDLMMDSENQAPHFGGFKRDTASGSSTGRSTPDTSENKEALSKRSMKELLAKAKQQEEILRRADERGNQTLNKAPLEKLSASTKELTRSPKTDQSQSDRSRSPVSSRKDEVLPKPSEKLKPKPKPQEELPKNVDEKKAEQTTKKFSLEKLLSRSKNEVMRDTTAMDYNPLDSASKKEREMIPKRPLKDLGAKPPKTIKTKGHGEPGKSSTQSSTQTSPLSLSSSTMPGSSNNGRYLQVSSNSMNPPETPDGPYHSTPDGSMEIKQRSRNTSGRIKKKAVVLHRVVSEFLERRVESIEELTISSSSSSDIRIDSLTTLSRTPSTTGTSTNTNSFFTPTDTSGSGVTGVNSSSSTHSTASKTWHTILSERALLDTPTTGTTEGGTGTGVGSLASSKNGGTSQSSRADGTSSRSTIAKATVQTFMDTTSDSSNKSKSTGTGGLSESSNGSGYAHIPTGSETSTLLNLSVLKQKVTIEELQSELEQLIQQEKASNPDYSPMGSSDPTRDMQDSAGEESEELTIGNLSARIRAIKAKAGPDVPGGDSPKSGKSGSASGEEKEVKRICEFIGDLSDCGDLWDSPPVQGTQSHAEIVSSIFDQLKDDWAGIMKIDRPPWAL